MVETSHARTNASPSFDSRAGTARTRILSCLLLGLTACSGCGSLIQDIFNPSFLQLFEVPGQGGGAFPASASDTSGHLPIVFRNNARIADDVFRYLIQGDTVVRQEVVEDLLRLNPQMTRDEITIIIESIINNSPANLEDLNLSPRVRLTMDVTNVDGGVQRLEFLEGLRLVRGEQQFGSTGGAGTIPPDLSENTNNIFIVQCDIAQLEIISVDVFIPVVLRAVTQQIVNTTAGPVAIEICTLNSPQFDRLDPDAGLSTESGEFTILRNFDPRFFPLPITNLQCGAVVVIKLTGDLALPFRAVLDPSCVPVVNPPADNRVPGFFLGIGTTNTEGLQIPGRYAVSLNVRAEN